MKLFEKKLHWYMLSYLKVSENGSAWGIANTYAGRTKPYVTKSDIRECAKFIECEEELTIQSVSYLGHMSDREFDNDE